MWLIRHARELGMTLHELLGRITSSEISEQMAYDRLQIRLAEEAEQARALSNTVEAGLQSIKREVKGRR